MINRCSICSEVIPRGEVFYQAHASSLIPTELPMTHKGYAVNLMRERLSDYMDLSICLNCLNTAKRHTPKQEKPLPNVRIGTGKPDPKARKKLQP